MTAHVTDDLAGLPNEWTPLPGVNGTVPWSLCGPDGRCLGSSFLARGPGSDLDVTYKDSFDVPSDMPDGEYSAGALNFIDNARNLAIWDADSLANAGFDSSLQVIRSGG